MSLSNLGIWGAFGETMALLGLGLLWTYREQAEFWLREFFGIWRGEISGRDALLSDPAYRRRIPRRPRGARLLVTAVALLFLGQILFILDLVY
jgi:hypothetical protein